MVPAGNIPPVPPSATPTPVASIGTDGFKKLYITRAVVWLCSLIVFSVTASIDNYSASDALKFVISMGVINWLYQSVLLGNYAGATFAHHEIMPVDMVENKYAKLGDIFMMFMFYTSTICASVDSSECIFSGVSDYHGSCSKLHAAACFSWFGFFGIIGGVFLRDPETFKKLVVGVKSDHYDDIDGASAGAPAVQQKAAVDL